MAKVLTMSRTLLSNHYRQIADVVSLIQHIEDGNLISCSFPIDDSFLNLPCSLMERSVAENDVNHLQIIPYITIYDQKEKKFLSYVRGSGVKLPDGTTNAEEVRLHQRRSIGVGGHVELEPFANFTLRELLTIEAAREIKEEIGYVMDREELESFASTLPKARLIYSETDPVGRVHLGISLILAINSDDLQHFEKGAIENPQWLTAVEMSQVYIYTKDYEEWSRIVIRSLIPNIEEFEHAIQAQLSAPEPFEQQSSETAGECIEDAGKAPVTGN